MHSCVEYGYKWLKLVAQLPGQRGAVLTCGPRGQCEHLYTVTIATSAARIVAKICVGVVFDAVHTAWT